MLWTGLETVAPGWEEGHSGYTQHKLQRSCQRIRHMFQYLMMQGRTWWQTECNAESILTQNNPNWLQLNFLPFFVIIFCQQIRNWGSLLFLWGHVGNELSAIQFWVLGPQVGLKYTSGSSKWFEASKVFAFFKNDLNQLPFLKALELSWVSHH